MTFFKNKNLLFYFIILSTCWQQMDAKVCLLTKKDSDIEIDFWGFFRPELFAGKNFNLLNNNVPQDTIFYFRHINDYFIDFLYGRETYGFPVVEFKSSVRNRAFWGAPGSVAQTLPANIRIGALEFGEHQHAFPRLFFWLREVWVKITLSELLNLNTDCDHSFTVGAFPYELGRGISLGAAYAIGPGPLGFYSDAMIDQFAFGFKFSGDVMPEVLKYDVYGSILQSRSYSFTETNRPVLRNEIDHRERPWRGFGKDNYLIAARLQWTACKNDWGTLTLEPYGLYNNDPEQKVEFVADANSKLGTFGFAGELVGGLFEFGFDAAVNIGRQGVLAWDRNYVVPANYNGQIVSENSQVTVVSDNQYNGIKAPDVPKSDAQKAINAQGNAGKPEYNGQIIPGTVDLPSLGYVQGPLSLQNSDIRYRPAYKNKYEGWMAVADASYWILKNELQVAGTVGYASGDQDPNYDVMDRNFKGFIGLQEVYAGKRVKNVFVLGTVGKVRRPGTQPENPQANKDFATSHNGFTNLIFVGSGLTWKPSSCADTQFICQPNIFAYWEPSPGKKFDALAGVDLPDEASKFMGVELNTFFSYYPVSSIKCYAIGSIFFPGKHFTDVRGKPANKEELKLLEEWRKTAAGHLLDNVPNINDSIAYTINIGFEFAF